MAAAVVTSPEIQRDFGVDAICACVGTYILPVGDDYLITPCGYDKDHQNANLLLLGGLTTAFETHIPDEFHSKDIVDYTLEKFKDMSPIHTWLLEMTRRLKK